MKIAFRISNMGFGGAERVFLSIAKILTQMQQVEAHFVVDQIGQGETEASVTEHGFKLFSLNCKRTLQSITPLKNYIDSQKPDVLISAYTDTNFAALISAKLAHHSCKTIVTEHASLKEHWQHSAFKRRLLLNAYVRFGYYLADHILAVSSGIAAQIIKMGHSPKHVSHIYNPVRFNSDQINNLCVLNKSQPVTILAIGRIAKQKDYLTLLKAFNLLKKQVNCRLVIVGGVYEADEKIKLDQFIAANEISSEIEFAGYTDNIQHHYANADVFVLSSAWEGFGNVIVEALAFGLPIISTDCNHGPAEILSNGKYGQLVPVGDWQSMAKALALAINSKAQVDSALLKKRALDFSEQTIAQQYWSLIKNITRS